MADIVFIDNFDSFTYNLVDQFRSLGHSVKIYRNNIPAKVVEAAINELDNPVALLSPGPGAPADAGCMPELIQLLKGKVPMIGICLGHQAIVEAYGGVVEGAGDIVHGKVSMMSHQKHATYANLPSPLAIARYHSLVVERESLPDCLEITAWVNNDDGTPGEIMGLRHKTLPIEGVQFHPESILTEHGHDMLQNFLNKK